MSGYLTAKSEEAKMSMEREYEFAMVHSTPACNTFMSLAKMYSDSPDIPTLGMLKAAAAAVRKEMEEAR